VARAKLTWSIRYDAAYETPNSLAKSETSSSLCITPVGQIAPRARLHRFFPFSPHSSVMVSSSYVAARQVHLSADTAQR